MALRIYRIHSSITAMMDVSIAGSIKPKFTNVAPRTVPYLINTINYMDILKYSVKHSR